MERQEPECFHVKDRDNKEEEADFRLLHIVHVVLPSRHSSITASTYTGTTSVDILSSMHILPGALTFIGLFCIIMWTINATRDITITRRGAHPNVFYTLVHRSCFLQFALGPITGNFNAWPILDNSLVPTLVQLVGDRKALTVSKWINTSSHRQIKWFSHFGVEDFGWPELNSI